MRLKIVISGILAKLETEMSIRVKRVVKNMKKAALLQFITFVQRTWMALMNLGIL